MEATFGHFPANFRFSGILVTNTGYGKEQWRLGSAVKQTAMTTLGEPGPEPEKGCTPIKKKSKQYSTVVICLILSWLDYIITILIPIL